MTEIVILETFHIVSPLDVVRVVVREHPAALAACLYGACMLLLMLFCAGHGKASHRPIAKSRAVTPRPRDPPLPSALKAQSRILQAPAGGRIRELSRRVSWSDRSEGPRIGPWTEAETLVSELLREITADKESGCSDSDGEGPSDARELQQFLAGVLGPEGTGPGAVAEQTIRAYVALLLSGLAPSNAGEVGPELAQQLSVLLAPEAELVEPNGTVGVGREEFVRKWGAGLGLILRRIPQGVHSTKGGRFEVEGPARAEAIESSPVPGAAWRVRVCYKLRLMFLATTVAEDFMCNAEGLLLRVTRSRIE